MARQKDIIALLERRIACGDYVAQPWPGERALAEQIGASRMTVRRAVQHLVDQGLLIRQPNGHLQVNRDRQSGRRLHIAHLAPSFASREFERTRIALQWAASRFNATLRAVDYVHWDDPIILETLEGFDGVFLTHDAEPMPPHLVERITSRRHRVVLTEADPRFTGVPSINLMPAIHVQKVLDHLAALGHRSVACFNVQPLVSASLRERVEQWRIWRAGHGFAGRLLNEPCKPYQDPVAKATEAAQQILAAQPLAETAVFCPTEPAAIGLVRALRDRGLTAGREVSVVTIDDMGLARHLCPSLTALQVPDPVPYVSVGLEWMARGAGEWLGPLCVQASDVSLFVGESSGPAPRVAADRSPPYRWE